MRNDDDCQGSVHQTPRRTTRQLSLLFSSHAESMRCAFSMPSRRHSLPSIDPNFITHCEILPEKPRHSSFLWQVERFFILRNVNISARKIDIDLCSVERPETEASRLRNDDECDASGREATSRDGFSFCVFKVFFLAVENVEIWRDSRCKNIWRWLWTVSFT